MSIQIVRNTLHKGLNEYYKRAKTADFKAKSALGLQLLNNVINGSPGVTVVPPILTGHLRGSGSAFVGSTLVGDSSAEYAAGKPNKNFQANNDVVTVGFDTPYAAKMHENIGIKYKLGPFSEQSGNVGPFFLRLHLEGDKNELWGLYASIYKKETGG
jgi:hypothetical protein